MRNWPLWVVLIALSMASGLKILMPGNVCGELASGIATILTLPAQLLTSMLIPAAFSYEFPHTTLDVVAIHTLWAVLAVGYAWVLKKLHSSTRHLWTTLIFSMVSLAVSGYLAYSLLRVWGCWRDDTPCLTEIDYLSFMAGCVTWAALGLWLSVSRISPRRAH